MSEQLVPEWWQNLNLDQRSKIIQDYNTKLINNAYTGTVAGAGGVAAAGLGLYTLLRMLKERERAIPTEKVLDRRAEGKINWLPLIGAGAAFGATPFIFSEDLRNKAHGHIKDFAGKAQGHIKNTTDQIKTQIDKLRPAFEVKQSSDSSQHMEDFAKSYKNNVSKLFNKIKKQIPYETQNITTVSGPTGVHEHVNTIKNEGHPLLQRLQKLLENMHTEETETTIQAAPIKKQGSFDSVIDATEYTPEWIENVKQLAKPYIAASAGAWDRTFGQENNQGKILTNPATWWTLASLGGTGMVALAMKDMIDKKYKPKNEEAKRVAEYEHQFKSLLKQSSSEYPLTSNFIDALEDEFMSKKADIYSALLPPIAVGSAGLTAFLTARHLHKRKSERDKALREAIRRFEVGERPKLHAEIVEDYDSGRNLDDLDMPNRNIIPVVNLRKRKEKEKDDRYDPFDKMSSTKKAFLGLGGSDGPSREELAQQFRNFVENSPDLAEALIGGARNAKPELNKFFGGEDAPTSEVIQNIMNSLEANYSNPANWYSAFKGSQLRKKLVENMQRPVADRLPENARRFGAKTNNPVSNYLNSVQTWQPLVAGGLGLAGHLTGHTGLGLLAGAGAMAAPQLYKHLRQVRNPAAVAQANNAYNQKTTPWLRGENTQLNRPNNALAASTGGANIRNKFSNLFNKQVPAPQQPTAIA